MEDEVSSGASLAPPRALPALAAQIRRLSDRLTAAQKPLRVLDAVRWPDAAEEAFFAAGCRSLPPVSPDSYPPLPFDPACQRQLLRDLERDARRLLGPHCAAGRLLARRCAECRAVVELLAQRGRPAFSALSERLYGSAADRCSPGGPTLAERARALADALGDGPDEPAALDAPEAARRLAERLGEFFGPTAGVRVRLCHGLAADAAVGGAVLKVRSAACFSGRAVRLLEVHEGWVHLGTSLNGRRQPVCTFLTRAAPSATLAQEGLAVLTEVLAQASSPARARRLAERVEAVARARDGADFLDLYRFFLGRGHSPREAYRCGVRVFRGSLPAAGPFTKDLCYYQGFRRVVRFVRQAAAGGQAGRVPLLFCGKAALDDVEALAELAGEGLLAPPAHLPPPFAGLDGPAWARLLDRLAPDDDLRPVSGPSQTPASGAASARR
jgi:uncharacterized protein (TIGR02421 family)